MNRKTKVAIIAAIAATLALTACTSDADRASENLSTAAEQFEIERHIVAINGITDAVMLEITGFCSIEDQGNQLEVTCKVGPDQYTKDFVGLSDNVSYVSEQLETADVSVYHRRLLIKPENFLPEFDVEAGDQ